MKKFFQRLDNSSSRHNSHHQQSDYSRETLGGGGGGGGGGSAPLGGAQSSASSSYGGSFIGKVFTLGQYHCTVEDIIAEGGFALVFLVKAQSSLGRFALKRLHVNNEADLANCKREIEIAKQLGSHKNIVQLVESSINYTASNGVYEILMLMQYCRGHLLQLLNDRLKEGGLPEAEVLRIACDLCEAVARMHHNDPPIIHRDLKVENILISEAGTYLLCDFGSATTKVLSTELNGMSALAIEEEIKRYTTLAYRSPEMVDVYSGKAISTKADIWALGCLLYKLCFLSLPFGESTLAIQNAQLTVPDTAEERFSPKMLSLLGYLLTADPDERPDIYQASALVFSLAAETLKRTDISNPVPNRTVTKKVVVPEWSTLKVPPTDSKARESREAASRKVSTVSNSGGNGAVMNASGTSSGALDPSGATTSVTPRQRPKASININSVLPTSPLPFSSTQRATTPSDLTTTANSLSISQPPGHVTLTSSASFNSGLRPAVENNTAVDDDEDDIDWSKKKAKGGGGKANSSSPPSVAVSGGGGQSSSNPQLNSGAAAAIYDHPAASKNPFLDSAAGAAVSNSTTSIPQPLPGPPQTSSGRRHSQTPPNSSAPAALNPPRELPSIHQLQNHLPNPHQHHHHHRRNMSDTSAFSSANVAAAAATVAAAAAAAAGGNSLAPPGTSNAATRVRSLNPFEDPNDVSYEDTLFGHEFDRIRQEVTSASSANNSGRHHSAHHQHQPIKYSNEHATSSNPRLDPFEAAPFNPAQLKRYFERQQSSETATVSSSSTSTTDPSTTYSGANSKPYLVHVGSAQSAEFHGTSSVSSSTSASSKSTVITIRSNNDFVIHSSNGVVNDGGKSLVASSSSAFVSLASPPITAAAGAPVNSIGDGPPTLACGVAASAQSNSSSSQGQITLGPAASYMPLYSSDTAEDSSDLNSSAESSEEADSSDDDSVKERRILEKKSSGVSVVGKSGNHLNGQMIEDDDDEEMVDGAHVAQEMSVDLMKPLVVDDEEEDEEEVEEEVEEEEEDFGSDGNSSIGSASDLQATDNSDDDDDDEDDDNEDADDSDNASSSSCGNCSNSSFEVTASPLKDDNSVDSAEVVGKIKGVKLQPTNQPSATTSSSQESRDGFVFVNYDGSSSKGHPTNWIKYASSESTSSQLKPGSQQISRITITMDSSEAAKGDLKSDDVIEEQKSGLNAPTIAGAATTDGEDGTSVGTSEVLSTASSVASSAARAINLDGTSASIDHLIGHIEGHRPLLEEEDFEDDDQQQQQVKLIEMDLECPPPTATGVGEAAADSVMYGSMTSSICSVVMKSAAENTTVDLLTEDPPIVSTDDHHFVIEDKNGGGSVGGGSANGESSEENDRRLDEEVAASLNSQVIYDQLTNKDLFGSVPFNDKELIQTTNKINSGKPAPAVVVEQQFESSFTELPPPSKVMTSEPPPTLPKPIASAAHLPTYVVPPPSNSVAAQSPSVSSSVPVNSTTTTPITKSTDLFGAIPFQQTVAVSPSAVSTAVAGSQQVKTSAGQPPLQIITLKPVNHGQAVTAGPPPVAPKPVIQGSLATPTTAAVTSKPIISVKQPPSTAPKPNAQPPVPQSPPSPSVVKSGTVVLLQKSNSSKLKKAKVAKKYEVDESDDEVDGLLEPDLLDDSEVVLDGAKDGKKDKKEKKKDKKDKEKPDKKSKEKEKNKEKEKEKSKEKEKEVKKKEKTKEPKPEKEKKVKEPKKTKEEKEKEKMEKKAQKAAEKAAAEREKLEAKAKEAKKSSKGSKETVESAPVQSTTAADGRKVIFNPACSTAISGDAKNDSQPATKKVAELTSRMANVISVGKPSSLITSAGKKLKVPKHQAFANMSFEDESTTTTTSSSTTTNKTSSSTTTNEVTITRC